MLTEDTRPLLQQDPGDESDREPDSTGPAGGR